MLLLTIVPNGTILAGVGTSAFLHLVQRLRLILAAEMRPVLRARGLAPSTVFLLDLVERHPYPSAICRELEMPPATVSRLLKQLEQEGYVVRERVPRDLRRHHFRLTPVGEAMRDEVQGLVRDAVEARLGRLDPHERAELERLLGRLVAEGDAGDGQ